jgi:hypothetical protein
MRHYTPPPGREGFRTSGSLSFQQQTVFLKGTFSLTRAAWDNINISGLLLKTGAVHVTG